MTIHALFWCSDCGNKVHATAALSPSLFPRFHGTAWPTHKMPQDAGFPTQHSRVICLGAPLQLKSREKAAAYCWSFNCIQESSLDFLVSCCKLHSCCCKTWHNHLTTGLLCPRAHTRVVAAFWGVKDLTTAPRVLKGCGSAGSNAPARPGCTDLPCGSPARKAGIGCPMAAIWGCFVETLGRARSNYTSVTITSITHQLPSEETWQLNNSAFIHHFHSN